MHHISNTFYPQLTRPKLSPFGNLTSEDLVPSTILAKYTPYMMAEIDPDKPCRKSMVAPNDTGAFVKPIKQSFIKNPRLSPMCRIMLTLLSGWAGKGGAIETTIGSIGKHLSRCRRQIHRYLEDAVEEGYLTYSRRKDRIGRYIGIKVHLNFAAIRFTEFIKPKSDKKLSKAAENIDVTLKTEINTKDYLSNNNTQDDTKLWEKLAHLATLLGYLDDKLPSS